MIRYQFDFGKQYFVEYFRSSTKVQNRNSDQKSDQIRSVSIVTTCMNRLCDLRKTLPSNLVDNDDYPCEFILVDYSSTDGLDEWIKSNMMHYIESKKLSYYQVLNQIYFKPNHSRNVSFKLASGEIIANVDADNFTHKGYAKAINECYVGQKTLVVPESFLNPNSNRLCLRGRFAIGSDDIKHLGGFDEDLDEGYSHDDVSFVFRAILNGFKISRFSDHFIENRIETPIEDRVKLVKNTNVDKMKKVNELITKDKLARCCIRANKSHEWGKATVIKNFSELIHV